MYLQENERRGAECIDQYMSAEDSRGLTNRYIKRQKVYRPRQKHSDPFLMPRVRFKKLRSSLNLSSLYLEMRLFFKRPWDRYQGILKRVEAYRLCVVDRFPTDPDDKRKLKVGSLMFEDKRRKESAR